MSIQSLDDLYVHTLKDIYYAEKKILKSLPKMIKQADDPKLKDAFEKHRMQTEGHVERLEQAFEECGAKPKAEKCDAIDGIVEEADGLMQEIEAGAVRDAAMLAAAQAVEHYEITRYGTLATWAKQLGHGKSAKLLEQTLAEEYAADKKLSSIAEGTLNRKAA